jgi:hypothetical protein
MRVRGERAMFSGLVSGNRAKWLQSLHALVLGLLLCGAPLSAALAQTTVNAGDTTAMPGDTASIPISIVLPSGTPCATLQYKLSVTGNGDAPAVSTNVTFTSSVGPTSQNTNPAGHPEQVLVGWFSNFSPLLTGTTQLGTLSVPIPATAQSGQTYTVQVLLPSGTTDGSTDLPMDGVSSTITIGGAPGPTPTATVAPTATPPSVNAGDVSAMPGDMAAVPISLVLPAGTQCATLQYKLSVTGNGDAPAVTTNVTFTSLVGPTSQNTNPAGHPEQVLVGWFSNFSPLLTGTTQLGTLSVPIPATAQVGQTYTVQVLLPSGTTDGSTDLPMDGVNGTIMIGGAPSPTATSTATNTSGAATLTPTPTSTPRVQPTTPSPTQVAVLTEDITAGDTTIPVSDISPFPDFGKIQIGQEIITYTGTQAGGGSSGNGGSAATLGVLLNAVRGAFGTEATAHHAGDPVLLFPSGGGGGVPLPEDSDGCSIATRGGNGNTWLLVIPAVGVLLIRRRRR